MLIVQRNINCAARGAPALAAFVFLFFTLLSFTDAQRLISIDVGRRGDELALRFTPEEVTANPGDQVRFQFYPLNHSAVEASFDNPCVPIRREGELTNGFFSGFQPLPRDTKTLNTFTIVINDTRPIFFYCSQGRHCQQGFAGAINPTPEQSLAAFKERAAVAPDNLSPGESPSDRRKKETPANGFGFGFNRNFNRTGNGNFGSRNANRKGVTNVGAIVGGVLGGVVFLIIVVTGAVFLVMRIRDRHVKRKQMKKLGALSKGKGKGKVDGEIIGRPQVESRYGPFGSGRV